MPRYTEKVDLAVAASSGSRSRRQRGLRSGGNIDIRLSLAGSAAPPRVYELAGQRLVSDLAIEDLAPFSAPAAGLAAAAPPAEPGDWSRARPVYAGPGWVGGRLRHVESRRAPSGYLLRIEAVGEFSVSADGAEIRRLRPGRRRSPDDETVAAVLGPCFALSLALRGTWCLHASAAGTRRAAVALIGESGSGKSTLAAALAAPGPGWCRIGDDLLPVRAEGAAARGLPRYPQPNLPADLQWSPPAPESVPLAAVYVLAPDAAEVAVRRLSRREAALALIRQTVAARLFDADLQVLHLDCCVELARRLPVHELRFPRRPAALPAMTAAVLGGARG